MRVHGSVGIDPCEPFGRRIALQKTDMALGMRAEQVFTLRQRGVALAQLGKHTTRTQAIDDGCDAGRRLRMGRAHLMALTRLVAEESGGHGYPCTYGVRLTWKCGERSRIRASRRQCRKRHRAPVHPGSCPDGACRRVAPQGYDADMESELLKATATVPTTVARRRRAPATSTAGDFSTQVAAFYPYPPVPEPGTRTPAPERPRGGTVSASTGIGRRRQPRED